MREVCQCAVTERMCVDSGRIYADNIQEMHRQRKWVCAVWERCVSAMCDVSVTTWRRLTRWDAKTREDVCKQRGYTQTTCIRSKAVMISCSEMRTDETSASSADMFPPQTWTRRRHDEIVWDQGERGITVTALVLWPNVGHQNCFSGGSLSACHGGRSVLVTFQASYRIALWNPFSFFSLRVISLLCLISYALTYLKTYVLHTLCTLILYTVVWCWLVILLHWLARPPRLKAD